MRREAVETSEVLRTAINASCRTVSVDIPHLPRLQAKSEELRTVGSVRVEVREFHRRLLSGIVMPLLSIAVPIGHAVISSRAISSSHASLSSRASSSSSIFRSSRAIVSSRDVCTVGEIEQRGACRHEDDEKRGDDFDVVLVDGKFLVFNHVIILLNL